MAPEQIEGREADARSDSFAFGLVLYEVLTGARAFEGKMQASIVASILALEPKPVRSLQADVPGPLERIVGHCLEKDPELRFQGTHHLKLQLRMVAECRRKLRKPCRHRRHRGGVARCDRGLLRA